MTEPIRTPPPAIEKAIPTADQINRYLASLQPSSAEDELTAMGAFSQHLDTLTPDARRRVLAYAADRYPPGGAVDMTMIISWTLGLLEAIAAHSKAGGGAEADATLWDVLKGTKFEVAR